VAKIRNNQLLFNAMYTTAKHSKSTMSAALLAEITPSDSLAAPVRGTTPAAASQNEKSGANAFSAQQEPQKGQPSGGKKKKKNVKNTIP